MARNLRTFDRSLPMALLRAREAVMKSFMPSLKEHGLTSQQWRVIRALINKDGLEITELAQQCYLLMPSLSRIINNLGKRGLVERLPVENDMRRSTVHITPEGIKLFDIIAPKSIERYEFIESKFGAGKLALLYELLNDLNDALDDAPKDEG